jgi:hypothetical protein
MMLIACDASLGRRGNQKDGLLGHLCSPEAHLMPAWLSIGHGVQAADFR